MCNLLYPEFQDKTNRFTLENYVNKPMDSFYQSRYGALFHDDCLNILPGIKSNIIDTIFADPPFNLRKIYGENTNDSLSEAKYLAWSKTWIQECVRVLKPGGSLFIYNLPRWNIMYGSYLFDLGMLFRHWIAIAMSTSLPIPGRLYPSHYSLLYYTKGKPNVFKRIRTPVELCRHCGKEIKDYGGHRKALNPNGVTLKDVWTDISPVRHWKFKDKRRGANALSTKLVSRVILMSTNVGDIVLDPFGGSGTTFDRCQNLGRFWIGVEIDYAEEIVSRIQNYHVGGHVSNDYVEK
jgi:site-specific DNA-methyltransferase (adenine-specific)